MEFVLLNEEEFRRFENKHIYGSFYQTVEWGKLKENNGWDPFYVGVKEDNKVIAASLLLRKKVFNKISIMYSPRGFLIDYTDYKILSYFTSNLKKFAKSKGAIFVKLDPYIILKERDINGDYIKDGIDNTNIVKNLLKLGYKNDLSSSKLQPQYAFVLNLKNKSLDQLFESMEPTTRKMIRKNEKMGIYCREIDISELKKFTDIMNDTSVRREFIDRPYKYYENMMNTFKEDIKVVIAEINLDNYIENINKEIKENKEEIVKKKKEIKENKNISIDKTNNIIEELNRVIDSLEKRLERGIELRKEKGNVVVLGGIMFLLHNKEMLSLFGGAYGNYKDFMAAYSTNWNMIKYAKENGYEKYNFYGISNFKDKNDKMYGLYDFKKGFGGNVEEYIGEYDLVTSKILYFVYTVLYNKIYVKIKMRKIKKSSID